MPAEQAHYRHDLGGGEYLDAYSIDPKIGESELRERVASKDVGSKVDLEEVGKGIRMIEHPEGKRLWSLGDLNFGAVDRKYQIPEQLKAYREAISIREDVNGNFNGPIAVVEGKPGRDIKFVEGGFYDWRGAQVADYPTDLLEDLMSLPVESLIGEARFRHAKEQEERFYSRYDARLVDRFRAKTLEEFCQIRGGSEETVKKFSGKTIGDLLEDDEFSRVFDLEAQQVTALRESYPAGKTLGELMSEYNLGDDSRARYFGFAYFMFPENGEKLQLVQRAKNMIVAPDCMASAGSTPPFSKDFFNPGFDFERYYQREIIKEMEEEFKLNKGEFRAEGFYFSHMVKTGILNPAFEITTPLTTENIASRIYGDGEAIGEHPIVYGMPLTALPKVLERFDVFPDIAFILNRLCQDTRVV